MINSYPDPELAILTQLTTADTRTIDTVHNKVHEGRFFTGGYYNSALADAGVIELLIQTSSTYYTHTIMRGSSNGDSTIQFYDGTTFSSAGTAMTISNHNRASAKTFSGTITHTPTITSVGTQINGTGFVPGGTKGSGSGGTFQGFGEEFILNLSTNYLLRITNVSGGACKISIHISAYQPLL